MEEEQERLAEMSQEEISLYNSHCACACHASVFYRPAENASSIQDAFGTSSAINGPKERVSVV